MDGGRILRALLAFALPQTKATSIATRIGQMLAVGLGFVALFMGNIVLAAISVFIFVSATSRAPVGRLRDAQVMVTGHALFCQTDPISRVVYEILLSDSDEFPVISSSGKLTGFLLRSDVIQHASEAGDLASDVRSDFADRRWEPTRPALPVADAGGDYSGVGNSSGEIAGSSISGCNGSVSGGRTGSGVGSRAGRSGGALGSIRSGSGGCVAIVGSIEARMSVMNALSTLCRRNDRGDLFGCVVDDILVDLRDDRGLEPFGAAFAKLAKRRRRCENYYLTAFLRLILVKRLCSAAREILLVLVVQIDFTHRASPG